MEKPEPGKPASGGWKAGTTLFGTETLFIFDLMFDNSLMIDNMEIQDNSRPDVTGKLHLCVSVHSLVAMSSVG